MPRSGILDDVKPLWPRCQMKFQLNYHSYLKQPLFVGEKRFFIIVLATSILLVACMGAQNEQQSRAENQMTPQNINSEYEQAVQAYWQGEYDTALNHVSKQIDRNASAELYNLQGSIYQQLGDHETAVASFDQAINLNNQFADSYNNRGLSWQMLAEDERAEADFRQAIAIEPTMAIAHYNLALLQYGRAEYAEAAVQLQEVVRLSPDDSDAWFQLGLTYDRLDQAEAAIVALTQSIEIDQGFDDQAFFLRGVIYAENGDFALGEADFNEAIRKGLRNAETLFYRGLMRYYLENYQLAVEDLQEAIVYEPQFADAYYYLSFTYARLGDEQKARQYAQRALELDPPLGYEE